MFKIVNNLVIQPSVNDTEKRYLAKERFDILIYGAVPVSQELEDHGISVKIPYPARGRVSIPCYLSLQKITLSDHVKCDLKIFM